MKGGEKRGLKEKSRGKRKEGVKETKGERNKERSERKKREVKKEVPLQAPLVVVVAVLPDPRAARSLRFSLSFRSNGRRISSDGYHPSSGRAALWLIQPVVRSVASLT